MHWIKFTLIKRPFYDPRTGDIISSVNRRENMPGDDPFVGGGKVYPNLDAVQVLERYEQGTDFLILIEADAVSLSELMAPRPVTYHATPTIDLTEPTGFQPRELSEAEARALLYQWGANH